MPDEHEVARQDTPTTNTTGTTFTASGNYEISFPTEKIIPLRPLDWKRWHNNLKKIPSEPDKFFGIAWALYGIAGGGFIWFLTVQFSALPTSEIEIRARQMSLLISLILALGFAIIATIAFIYYRSIKKIEKASVDSISQDMESVFRNHCPNESFE
jgi:hypothetical protein